MNRAGTVYGQGLYALAKDEGLEDCILQELEVLNTAFAEQPEYLKLLASANVPKEERLGILEQDFGGKVQQYLLNFLKLLTEKGYIRRFEDCCRAYRSFYNADKGILEVKAVSATQLSDVQKKRLIDKLSAMTGKKIALFCWEDPSVLGGIRLSYDGTQVDGTLQGRLEAMKKQLKNTVI